MMTRILLMMSLLLAGLMACSPSPPAPVEGDVCGDILDCAPSPNLACALNVCSRVECVRSQGCPVGAACVRGLCGLPECFEDTECPGSAVLCFEGACRDDICRDKSECPDGQVCLGEPGQCAPPPSLCSRDSECLGDRRCKLATGQCLEPCANDLACDADAYCDGTFCRALCEDEAACDPGELCIEGRCAPPPDCSMEEPCPPSAPFRDPATCTCLGCRDDTDCDTSREEACVESTCSYCPVRETDAAICAAQGLVQLGACCVRCIDDVDCGGREGLVCEQNRCIDGRDRRCLTDAECPLGEQCDGERCARVPSSRMACTRQSECPGDESCHANGVCLRAPALCGGGCPADSRCVAEPGDVLGTCAGCQATCAEDGCPSGTRCFVPEGQPEGTCVDTSFIPGLCP